MINLTQMSSRKNAYQKGAQSERGLIHRLERYGFICFRTAGSGKHGKIDVICIKNGKTILFDVKARFYTFEVCYENEYLKYLKEIYEKHRVDVYLAIYLRYYGKYFLFHIKDVQLSNTSFTCFYSGYIREKGIPIDTFILMY